MRTKSILNASSSPLRLTVALLLAGAAAGCSSDVTRFDGLFGAKTDTLTTASIPHRSNAVNGKLPTPGANINSVAVTQTDVTGDQALNQPFPVQQDVSYDPISTSTIDARAA